jgi:large subunit ribosomal protein L19
MAQDENKKENKEDQVEETSTEEVKSEDTVKDVEEKKEEVVEKEENTEEKEEVTDEEINEDLPEISEDENEENVPEDDGASDVSDGSEVAEEVEEEVAEEEKIDESGLPEFNVGDTIRVNYKIVEGEKVRTQPFQGIVIAMKGTGPSKTFTVRKIGADNVGVERIFPFQSPNIDSIKVMRRGKVRRAKLYYLRGRVGRKATRIKEKVVAK